VSDVSNVHSGSDRTGVHRRAHRFNGGWFLICSLYERSLGSSVGTGILTVQLEYGFHDAVADGVMQSKRLSTAWKRASFGGQ